MINARYQNQAAGLSALVQNLRDDLVEDPTVSGKAVSEVAKALNALRRAERILGGLTAEDPRQPGDPLI